MKIFNCRLCDNKLGDPVIKLPPTPLANDYLEHPEPQDLFPLEICCCTECGHYQLNEQVEPERMFRHYLFVAGTSPVNVQHFGDYALRLLEMLIAQDPYVMLRKTPKVLDIASNDGTLLQHFKNMGFNVLGIDPAVNLAEEATLNGIPTIPDFFTEEKADEILQQHGKFDLITANNVFAHIPDMIGFTKGIKKLLAPEGIYTFEVSYFVDVCDKGLFDTIYHEHTSFHHLYPLMKFFRKQKLNICFVERIPTHGGSIRVYVDHYKGPINECIGDTSWWRMFFAEDRIVDKVNNLSQKIDQLKVDLTSKLMEFKSQGKSIAIYGTPAKLTTALYAFDIKSNIFREAYDDSIYKQNRYTPGLHIPILNPNELLKNKPDILYIGAWNFAPSIIDNCRKMGFNGKFIVPLPKMEIY